jgi:glycopeptide antibiotics resistance protein
MDRKFWISAAVMFVMAMVLSYVVHGVLLQADYLKLGAAMRPPAEAQARFAYFVIAYISMAVAFTWIYLKGRENKPWLMQGARYGVAVVLLTILPFYLIYHVVTPVPLDLAIKQIVYEGIAVVLMGVVLAWINR